MTVRERLEQTELTLLAPQAQKSAESKGRAYAEEEAEGRTCYQRDTDRIVHSKAFRRRVLSQLSSNYNLLSTVLQSGADSILLSDIVAMGFVPGIVTSYSRVGKHDEFGCFDIKYRMTATKLSSIIKIQNVSLNLHADSDSE